MDTPTTVFSHCESCRKKLEHTALFCPKCGLSTCSWDCYVHHLATHLSSAARPANGAFHPHAVVSEH